MDPRQLRFAVELGRTRHFTRAAERLGVTQPALSHAIAALERELGVTLFARTSRRVAPTAAGAALLAGAERILGDLEALRATVREHAEVLRGRIDVGTMLFLGGTALPQLVAEFHRQHPGVEFVLHHDLTQDMLAGLRVGTLDVAFVNVDAAAHRDLTFVGIDRDELAVAVPPQHRLAGARRVRLADLAGEPFIAYQTGSGLYTTFSAAAARAGFTPRVVVQCRDTNMVRALVSEGVGLALLPRSYLRTPGPDVAVVSLSAPRLEMLVTLGVRPAVDSNPAARAFVAFLRERIEVPGGE
jgi:LysR family transcriptional activator of glutamate synthase operon